MNPSLNTILANMSQLIDYVLEMKKNWWNTNQELRDIRTELHEANVALRDNNMELHSLRMELRMLKERRRFNSGEFEDRNHLTSTEPQWLDRRHNDAGVNPPRNGGSRALLVTPGLPLLNNPPSFTFSNDSRVGPDGDFVEGNSGIGTNSCYIPGKPSNGGGNDLGHIPDKPDGCFSGLRPMMTFGGALLPIHNNLASGGINTNNCNMFSECDGTNSNFRNRTLDTISSPMRFTDKWSPTGRVASGNSFTIRNGSLRPTASGNNRTNTGEHLRVVNVRPTAHAACTPFRENGNEPSIPPSSKNQTPLLETPTALGKSFPQREVIYPPGSNERPKRTIVRSRPTLRSSVTVPVPTNESTPSPHRSQSPPSIVSPGRFPRVPLDTESTYNRSKCLPPSSPSTPNSMKTDGGGDRRASPLVGGFRRTLLPGRSPWYVSDDSPSRLPKESSGTCNKSVGHGLNDDDSESDDRYVPPKRQRYHKD